MIKYFILLLFLWYYCNSEFDRSDVFLLKHYLQVHSFKQFAEVLYVMISS